MPSDRVLVEIISSFNATGVKEAQAGFLGMSSGLTALIAGIGLAVVAGKSAVEISEKHQKAEKDLAQAIDATGGNLNTAKGFLDAFIGSNRAYVDDQSQVIDGYAALLRSGLSQTEAQKDMNRALDLAGLKNISLAEAVDIINKAEHGRVRGLVDLGITSGKYVDSSGNVIDANHNMAKVMAELDAKTAHGRDTMTETSQVTHKLGNDWQDIANIAGPPLINTIDFIASGADWALQKLKALGEDTSWNVFLAGAFGNVQNAVVDVVHAIEAVIHGIQWIGEHSNMIPGAGSSSGGGGRYRTPIPGASGFSGTVSGPTLFLAGEGGGKEHVEITPGGGSNRAQINIHIHGGIFTDGPSVDKLANTIALRLGYATGR